MSGACRSSASATCVLCSLLPLCAQVLSDPSGPYLLNMFCDAYKHPWPNRFREALLLTITSGGYDRHPAALAIAEGHQRAKVYSYKEWWVRVVRTYTRSIEEAGGLERLLKSVEENLHAPASAEPSAPSRLPLALPAPGGVGSVSTVGAAGLAASSAPPILGSSAPDTSLVAYGGSQSATAVLFDLLNRHGRLLSFQVRGGGEQ